MRRSLALAALVLLGCAGLAAADGDSCSDYDSKYFGLSGYSYGVSKSDYDNYYKDAAESWFAKYYYSLYYKIYGYYYTKAVVKDVVLQPYCATSYYYVPVTYYPTYAECKYVVKLVIEVENKYGKYELYYLLEIKVNWYKDRHYPSYYKYDKYEWYEKESRRMLGSTDDKDVCKAYDEQYDFWSYVSESDYYGYAPEAAKAFVLNHYRDLYYSIYKYYYKRAELKEVKHIPHCYAPYYTPVSYTYYNNGYGYADCEYHLYLTIEVEDDYGKKYTYYYPLTIKTKWYKDHKTPYYYYYDEKHVYYY